MLKQFVKKENVIIDNENWTEVKIKIDKLLSNLKSSDFHKIIEEYKKVEIENHKFMNDIFLNPQNYVVKNSKGETIPKKNLLLKPKRREVIQAQESKTV